MRWYVYGLTDGSTGELELGTGLGEHPVQVLGAGPVRLLASRAPEDIGDLAAAAPDDVVAAVLQHDQVLLQLATQRTVVPARFGTLLADDDAVAELLADPDGRLAAQVDRLAGSAEWVLNVAVDQDQAGDTTEAADDDLSPGHAYFARRRAATAARTRARDRAVAVAEDLDARLRDVALDFAPLDLRQPDTVARGAYLVRHADVDRLRDVVDGAGPGGVVELRGPLPAYRFAAVTG